MRLFLPSFFLLVAAIFHPLAVALACDGQAPVLELNLGPYDLSAPSIVSLGEWWLPRSSDHPNSLTPAKVRLELHPDEVSADWTLIAYFSYNVELGIPYSFQMLQSDWITQKENSGSGKLDWSNQCNSVGRSMFPHKKFSDSLVLTGAVSGTGFKSIKIRLWGSQN